MRVIEHESLPQAVGHLVRRSRSLEMAREAAGLPLDGSSTAAEAVR